MDPQHIENMFMIIQQIDLDELNNIFNLDPNVLFLMQEAYKEMKKTPRLQNHRIKVGNFMEYYDELYSEIIHIKNSTIIDENSIDYIDMNTNVNIIINKENYKGEYLTIYNLLYLILSDIFYASRKYYEFSEYKRNYDTAVEQSNLVSDNLNNLIDKAYGVVYGPIVSIQDKIIELFNNPTFNSDYRFYSENLVLPPYLLPPESDPIIGFQRRLDLLRDPLGGKKRKKNKKISKKTKKKSKKLRKQSKKSRKLKKSKSKKKIKY